jgi:hypothetical protein
MNTLDDMYVKVKQYAKYTLHIALVVAFLLVANTLYVRYTAYLEVLTEVRCPSALSIPRSWRDTIIQVNLVTGPFNEQICFDYLSKSVNKTTSPLTPQ